MPMTRSLRDNIVHHFLCPANLKEYAITHHAPPLCKIIDHCNSGRWSSPVATFKASKVAWYLRFEEEVSSAVPPSCIAEQDERKVLNIAFEACDSFTCRTVSNKRIFIALLLLKLLTVFSNVNAQLKKIVSGRGKQRNRKKTSRIWLGWRRTTKGLLQLWRWRASMMSWPTVRTLWNT